MSRGGRLAGRAGGREAEIAGMAADALAALDPPPAGRILVAGDADGAVERALAAAGATVLPWHRLALNGRPALPWPGGAGEGGGAVDGAVLRLPRGWGAFAMSLHALASRLTPGAPLWIYGGNDEGITSVATRLEGVVAEPETLTVKRRARLLRTRRLAGGPPPRSDPEDWRETVEVAVPGLPAPLPLVSYPGLFAHGRLDPGTECLLGVLPDLRDGLRVLDFGCGAGVIGRTVRERCAGADLTLLDVDALALHAARQNVPGAACVLSDGWSGLAPRDRFDLILSNPPLHRGKEEDFGTLDALVRGAGERLRPGGTLLAVVQRTAGAGALFKAAFATTELRAETPQYQVWCGVAGRR
ncbi:methyltransferase [Azospirillum halopraeferens]|uniref:methyltransferase n=1 Tax=Azospirillum halopraeferens TaxID=34010 RepID=UPI00041AE996|nr:methyltransferase [Azospirillum halopraeferens]